MSELGISIYPSKSSFDEMQSYLTQARELGYKKIFTSLLEVTGDTATVVDHFKKIIQYGNQIGMQTCIDINPKLFKQLNIDYSDLSFFKELGVTTIRLDEGFTGYEEAKMTFNPWHLKIETNISRGQHYIDMVCDFGANTKNLSGSHNFYPQVRTGLQKNYFKDTAKMYKAHNLETSAFIDGDTGKVGPWPVSNKMVSMEIQRDMSAASQVQLIKQTNLIDNIYISSSLLELEELSAIKAAFLSPYPVLEVSLNPNISDVEHRIAIEELQMFRGDYSGYMIRSSQSRIKYRDAEIMPNNLANVQFGDIVIGNSSFGQYKGELQIALQPWENDGHYNVVGKIDETNLAILKTIKPWQTFKLINN
ncbi:DUF871 domain-containing protein [Leuconostoc gasicomitatum]|uniref:DUF871 domain-containing protein n=1 Tax=Leuconostoc gasicomitatum TaxID=115778 RepID=UPI001CC76FA1|nr:MupG family TIM beta-alpha barrel fold protein [Leuconostoc gasicomitatum]MBZ5969253.1 DUF871 domain-containing protein [Leuconostoc gasicomitatum]MBZ5998740.1 DUF871 domain-containing protein [Leuconostoc gasicomitatum]